MNKSYVLYKDEDDDSLEKISPGDLFWFDGVLYMAVSIQICGIGCILRTYEGRVVTGKASDVKEVIDDFLFGVALANAGHEIGNVVCICLERNERVGIVKARDIESVVIKGEE